MNRRRAGLLAVAAAALLLGATLGVIVVRGNRLPTSPPGADAAVAKVDGVPIPTRELAVYLDQDRSAVVDYFQKHFGAHDSGSFWTTSFAGQTPTERLEAAALTDATRTAVQFTLAHQYKLVISPGYSDFVESWQTENQRRAQALAAHQPIYGPQQYTEANYLTYVIGNLGYELQDKLAADGTFDASDVTLQSYYLQHVSDFSTSQIGPSPIDYDAVKVQVRLAYLNAQYLTLIDHRVASARVTTTAGMRRLLESGCISTGTCSTA